MTPPKRTSYWDYIKVEELLALQTGIADDEAGLSNDEVRFIVVHQVDELWFKLVLRELRAVRDALAAERVAEDRVPQAVHHLRRVNEIMRVAGEHWRVVTAAATEVGPALFFSLLIITLSFLPVFTLEAQEGRLFSPLAFTKTYAMAAAAGLAVTLVPVLMGYLIRGRIPSEKANPLNRFRID